MRAFVVLVTALASMGLATTTNAAPYPGLGATSKLPAALYGVTASRQLRPTILIPIAALSADRGEQATYVETNTSAAIALLRHLKPATGYWSTAYPSSCPALHSLEGETGGGMGALALANCGHPSIVLVEWHGGTKLGVVLPYNGPFRGPVPEYTGNVAFFFDDVTTGKAIGGFLAEVPHGQIALSSLGAPSSVTLPSRALPVQHPKGVRAIAL